MSLRKAIEVVASLAAQGVIKQYAIAGAVAALNYVEATLTEDLDILVSSETFGQSAAGLILLTPIEEALAKSGYKERTDVGIWIDGWPVQFLPASSPLDEEGLQEAIEVEVGLDTNDRFRARVLRAEHVVATALKLGRLKDLARVEAFLEQGVVDLARLRTVLVRHDLLGSWKAFCIKAGKPDLLT